jgi:hypothetical protein
VPEKRPEIESNPVIKLYAHWASRQTHPLSLPVILLISLNLE